jgi:glycosyltransferase involved in cell wall biosynthesis
MLSVIIITRDERLNLVHALESLRPLGCQVFIVDSGSTDGTVELARQLGCQVVSRGWTNYADQFGWAMEHLPFETPWVMRLDADERLTPELAAELAEVLPSAPKEVAGFELKRRVYFWGRWIKHGGYYPTWLLRVWRRGQASIESRWMDEHMVLSSGAQRSLRHDIIDENHKGLTFWVDKHNRYADREVRDMLAIAALSQRRWLKANVYARTPPFLRAFLYWGFRYFLKLGFLDGLPGLVFHFNQGLWYRLLVDAKLREAKMASARAAGQDRPSP